MTNSVCDDHWPNFIAIGPGKTGTSWLYKVLDEHPDVCMSSAKETTFFDDHYHHGLDWYQKFFRNCQHASPATQHAVGEISNTYIFCAEAAERIALHFPEMKILSTLRNPIDRAFSHYLFECRNGSLTCDFEQAIQQRPDFLERGLYFKHLTPYLDQFPASQMHVRLFDDFTQDTIGFAQELFAFMGIAMPEDEQALVSRVLGASKARNRYVAKAAVGVARLLRKVGRPELITRVKNGVLPRLLFRPIDRSEYPTMKSETRRRLVDYFAADTESLSSMLGKDCLSMWDYDAEPTLVSEVSDSLGEKSAYAEPA